MQERRSINRANAFLACTSALGSLTSIFYSTYELMENYSPANAVPHLVVGTLGLVAAEMLCPNPVPVSETQATTTESAIDQPDQEQC